MGCRLFGGEIILGIVHGKKISNNGAAENLTSTQKSDYQKINM